MACPSSTMSSAWRGVPSTPPHIIFRKGADPPAAWRDGGGTSPPLQQAPGTCYPFLRGRSNHALSLESLFKAPDDHGCTGARFSHMGGGEGGTSPISKNPEKGGRGCLIHSRQGGYPPFLTGSGMMVSVVGPQEIMGGTHGGWVPLLSPAGTPPSCSQNPEGFLGSQQIRWGYPQLTLRRVCSPKICSSSETSRRQVSDTIEVLYSPT